MSKNKGITLVSLVITIIIMLVISGTAIAYTLDGNNLFQKAEESKSRATESTMDDSKVLSAVLAGSNFQETTFNGVKIPAGFAPTQIDGESTIDEGLVIVDSEGNEYVWIEVPNDGSGPNYTGVEVNNNIDTTKIYTALTDYCKKDSNGNNLITNVSNDQWYDSNGKTASNSTNLNDTAVCGLTNAQYNELLNKMLISVYQNGGFWIGRYEAGSPTLRTNSSESIEGFKVCSKKNLYPINIVSCSQGQALASSVINDSQYSSSLLFGIQWDLVIKFLNSKGASTESLNVDSGSWGNYTNSSFIINRGMYSLSSPWTTFSPYKTPSANGEVTFTNNISQKTGSDENNVSVLLTTGASDKNKKNNIYDLAGNIYELTLMIQKYSNTPSCVTYRGGAAWGLSTGNTASSRLCYDYDKTIGVSYGFRVTIY